MLLRASSIHTGESFDVSGLTSEDGRPIGVDGEEILLKFAESAVRREEKPLAEAREAIELRFGREGLVEAAATVAAFQRLNRVADACGIALDDGFAMMSADLQTELDVDGYASAANTPKPTGLKRLVRLLMRPLGGFMLRAMQKGIQKGKARQAGASQR